MLYEHLRYIEELLVSKINVSSQFGHKTDKGSAREFFIQDFLQTHISENIGIGRGEIIDSNSKGKDDKNQIDLLLYDKSYPTLDISLGGGLKSYLSESIIASIEVKSFLNKKSLFDSLDAIRNTKNLSRNLIPLEAIDWMPKGIFSYIIAYDGDSISSIKDNIDLYLKERKIQIPDLDSIPENRFGTICPIVDLIVILKKGFIKFDNTPCIIVTDDMRKKSPKSKWLIDNKSEDNLAVLFFELLNVLSTKAISKLNTEKYFNPKLSPLGDFVS